MNNTLAETTTRAMNLSWTTLMVPKFIALHRDEANDQLKRRLITHLEMRYHQRKRHSFRILGLHLSHFSKMNIMGHNLTKRKKKYLRGSVCFSIELDGSLSYTSGKF